jgi:hypothetical protein
MAKYVIRQQNTYFHQKRTHFRRTEKDRQKKIYFPQKKTHRNNIIDKHFIYLLFTQTHSS